MIRVADDALALIQARSMSQLRDKLISAQGRATAVLTRPALEFRRRVLMPFNAETVPIIVNNRNRLEYLRLQLDWLEKAHFANIIIVDNASDYPKLMEFYNTTRHRVIRLPHNSGPFSLWRTPLYWSLCRSYFVLTDSDILPVPECPADVLWKFFSLLCKYNAVNKVGFSLAIDDIPDWYLNKKRVVQWEGQFWKTELESGVYSAPIDTTFALYRPWTHWYHGRAAIRTGFPYAARHLPWYIDSRNLGEEDAYYEENVGAGFSWWMGKGAVGVETPAGDTVAGTSARESVDADGDPHG
jgi:hypothetical protein